MGKKSSSLIDLYNFEEPQFERSQYILTSPRSLKACSQLKIKPVELLHKPFSEFETELKSLGLSHTAIFAAYQKYEKQRLDKLERARNKRQTLVANEETQRDPLFASRITVTEPEKPGIFPQKQQTMQTSSVLTSSKVLFTCTCLVSELYTVVAQSAPQYGTGLSSRLGDLELVGKGIDVHSGRVQHSQQNANMHSMEMKDEKSQLKSTYPKSAQSQSMPLTAMPKTQMPIPNSQEAGGSHRHRAVTSNGTNGSTESGSVKVSVRKSKSEQWKRTGQTFRDFTLADVPVRDQRILQLMVTRRKEEQLLSEKQNAIALEWEREKTTSKQQQEVSERKYREMLEKLRKQSREIKVCNNE
jgi:hypothetical protein